MVKEKASLKQAVPSLLAALDQIIAHPSKAEDTGSIIWTGTHLAQCTVNTLSGSCQLSMPLMASTLLDNKSIVSSELFRYVFPHKKCILGEHIDRVWFKFVTWWMCKELTFNGWKQWIFTILSCCSHGSSLEKRWSQWGLWRRKFAQSNRWQGSILNSSWIMSSSWSGVCSLFSVGIWVHRPPSRKKSNFRKKQNWQTNLRKIIVINQDQHFPWE
jgi:hypothetical protein